MKILLLIVVLISTIGSCFSQELELLGVEYARYPNANIKTADSLEANFTEFEIMARFPVLNKKKFTLLAGGTYRLVIPDGNFRDSGSNLFFLALNLVGSYKVSEKGQLIVAAIPATSTATESRSITSDNFLMQGAILYRKKVSETFSYTLGVLSTSRFGSPLIVPSLGLSHKGDKVKLDINLPLLIQSMWNYEKDFSYGLKLSVNGSQYNFENESFNGNEVDLARFSRVRLGPELQYCIKAPLVFTLYGGIAANRTYDFDVEGAEDIDFSLDNGPFIAARLSLKPQMKNK